MSDQIDLDFDPALDRWMDAVAPDRAPSSLLEETFARTMAASQDRPMPWRRIPIAAPPPSRFGPAAWIALVALLAGAVAVVALIGGGGRHVPTDGIPAPTASTSPSGRLGPSASPSGPVPVSVVPEATITVQQPIYMGTDGAVPWLITEAGEIVRIDPVTNSIGGSSQIGPPGDPYQGLAADAHAVWITDWITQKIFRVDPGTLEVAETITAGAGSKGVIVTEAGVWLADTRGGAVLRIDPTTNDVVASVNVGPTGAAGPNWLAAGAESVWVDVPNNNTVARIDPRTDTVQATIDAPEGFIPCGGIAASTDAAWVTGCAAQKQLIVIDAATNTVRSTVPLDGFGYYPAMIDGAPWVALNRERADNGQLVRIDPVTDSIDRVIVPGTTFHGGGNIVVAAGSVWVFDALHDTLIRLPLSAFGP